LRVWLFRRRTWGDHLDVVGAVGTVRAELPRDERRDVFFGLSEPAREALVADMSRSQLERFTDRLDPDEVTDVLGYANAETREAVCSEPSTPSGARRSTSCCRSIPRARPG